MATDKKWNEYAKLAKHYKAIGQTDIYLCREAYAPWHLVTDVESGAAHRLNIPVSMSFRAMDRKSGLSFRWSFDIEKANAQGHGQFLLDLPRIRAVRSVLPIHIAPKFDALLKATAAAVRKQGDEYSSVAREQYGYAAELEQLER